MLYQHIFNYKTSDLICQDFPDLCPKELEQSCFENQLKSPNPERIWLTANQMSKFVKFRQKRNYMQKGKYAYCIKITRPDKANYQPILK